MITVIDYKMINLGSILNMLKKVGCRDVVIATTPEEVQRAKKIIMPGVGSFDHAMKNLQSMNLVDSLRSKALEEKVPFLGVCLGMQLMTESSEEGKLQGLGFIKAGCRRFQFEKGSPLKSPHMGWNKTITRKKSDLLNEDEHRFYFVHSYYVSCDNPADVLLTTHHGREFVSGFQKENLMGVQFHPEKSHSNGIELFRNFLEKF